MTLPVTELFNALTSHASSTGLFDRVNSYEPKSAPGNGLTAAVWVQEIRPHAASSGLSATSARVEFAIRLYSAMLAEPQDAIDPNLVQAVDALIGAYSGDFTLGDNVRGVDLLGQTGTPLQARAAYLNQDSKLYRVFDITLPVIVNDLWSQSG